MHFSHPAHRTCCHNLLLVLCLEVLVWELDRGLLAASAPLEYMLTRHVFVLVIRSVRETLKRVALKMEANSKGPRRPGGQMAQQTSTATSESASEADEPRDKGLQAPAANGAAAATHSHTAPHDSASADTTPSAQAQTYGAVQAQTLVHNDERADADTERGLVFFFDLCCSTSGRFRRNQLTRPISPLLSNRTISNTTMHLSFH